MRTKLSPGLLVVAVLAALASTAMAGNCSCDCDSRAETARMYRGYRTYRNYPYTHSYGYRADPSWSYNTSSHPYPYHGDGSYYGLGYSGYNSHGDSGTYWYW